MGTITYLWTVEKRASAIYMSAFTVIFAGALLAMSNALAFIVLPVRAAFASILYLCSLSASIGARDATTLAAGNNNSNFPDVVIRSEGGSTMGKLIFQTSTATLVFDPLRRFTQIPTGKIVEVKYLPQ